MGSTIASSPSPVDPEAKPPSIEADISQEQGSNIPGIQMTGPDIEADIEADLKKIE
jgi:hypothetical protein